MEKGIIGRVFNFIVTTVVFIFWAAVTIFGGKILLNLSNSVDGLLFNMLNLSGTMLETIGIICLFAAPLIAIVYNRKDLDG